LPEYPILAKLHRTATSVMKLCFLEHLDFHKVVRWYINLLHKMKFAMLT